MVEKWKPRKLSKITASLNVEMWIGGQMIIRFGVTFGAFFLHVSQQGIKHQNTKNKSFQESKYFA